MSTVDMGKKNLLKVFFHYRTILVPYWERLNYMHYHMQIELQKSQKIVVNDLHEYK